MYTLWWARSRVTSAPSPWNPRASANVAGIAKNGRTKRIAAGIAKDYAERLSESHHQCTRLDALFRGECTERKCSCSVCCSNALRLPGLAAPAVSLEQLAGLYVERFAQRVHQIRV